MCHDHDSRPPAPPRSGDVAERGVLTLTSADGTEFSAAYAAPAAEPGVGVRRAARRPRAAPVLRGARRAVRRDRGGHRGDRLVRPDGGPLRRVGHPARGLRLAGAHPADVRGRRSTPTSRRPSATCAPARATTCPVVTVGFCFGGSHSWRQSGGDLDLAGCAGFYGKPSVVGAAAERAHLPVVMLIAGADRRRRWPTSCSWPTRCAPRAPRWTPSSTTARRTRSSTARSASGKRPARTPGEHVLALTDRVAAR